MTSSSLVAPEDLSAFPGAPFDEALVDMAGASVRAEAGWHIAPLVTETLSLKSWGDTQELFLPSQRVVSISAVQFGLVTYTDWTLTPDGLYRLIGWPVGRVDVTLTHGYAEVPQELLPIIAQRVKSSSVASNVSQRTTTTGPFSESETYRDVAASATDPVVSRYSVRTGVG